jgi:prepilin-type N-terminal cleavage/methylation domain-containing protein
MHKKMRGFSLIELMIVIAIVGILSTLASASYVSYVSRAKISEILTMLDSYKPYIMESISTNMTFPAQLGPLSALSWGTCAGVGANFNQTNGGTANTQYMWWNSCNSARSAWVGIQVSPALGGGAAGTGNYGFIYLLGVITSTAPLTVAWYCGSWDDGSTGNGFAPVGDKAWAYLPSTCSRKDLGSLI